MKRWLPSLPLTLALFVVWLLLNQSLHPATLVSAAVLSLVVPVLTQGLRPAAVRMRKPWLAVRLVGVVVHDLTASVLAVAWRLLTRRTADIHGRFVHVPLRMRDPNALAVLSMIMCLTPGTAWGEVTLDRSVLLLHIFDLDDDAAFIATLRERYETPLMEIFES